MWQLGKLRTASSFGRVKHDSDSGSLSRKGTGALPGILSQSVRFGFVIMTKVRPFRWFRSSKPRAERRAPNSTRRASNVALFLLLVTTGVWAPNVGLAGSAINVELFGGLSNSVYVGPGSVTIDYSYRLMLGAIRHPVTGNEDDVQASNIFIYDSSDQVIGNVPIVPDIWNDEGSGSATWNNPTGQYIKLSGDVAIFNVGFYEWLYLPAGQSVATGGDTPPGGPVTSGGSAQTTPTPPRTAVSGSSTNIHAVIISGLSDPAKVIVSPNVSVTGGIVALGKGGAMADGSSTWSPGLRILPDYELLTGAKIPPVTPNIIDVRIVRQQVIAEFPSPSDQAGQ
jgi:hypothetical protein